MTQTAFGLLHVFSVIFLTAVVAIVIGLHEAEDQPDPKRHVLGCWVKMLGGMVALGIIVYIMSLLSGPRP